MQSTLDMAKRLNQKSLLQIAAEVALLNHVAIPHPLSLLGLMKLFANVAKPEAPTNLVEEFDTPTYAPTPIISNFSWTDPGQNRSAMRLVIVADSWSSSTVVTRFSALMTICGPLTLLRSSKVLSAMTLNTKRAYWPGTTGGRVNGRGLKGPLPTIPIRPRRAPGSHPRRKRCHNTAKSSSGTATRRR
jgi:hypothetical protein